MAKTLKPKTSSAAKSTKTKKATAAKKPAMKAKKAEAPKETPATTHEPDNFMWRLLKKKEAERKRLAEEGKKLPLGHGQQPLGNQPHVRTDAFTKFAGPRRKAG